MLQSLIIGGETGHLQARYRSVLHGERDDTIVSVGREPGALCIFRSCNSPHRTMRIMGVFVYEREPGVLGDPEVNETIYGQRVAAT